MKRALTFIIGVAMLSLMVSCGSTNESTTSSESEQSEISDENFTLSETEQPESMPYDVEVYSDRRLSITLNEISSDKVIFSVSNTSDSSFTLSIYFALDGQVIPGYNSAFQLEPGETSDLVWQCTISNTDHKYLSMYGIVFIDNSSVDFSVCDLDIGGEEHEEYDYESGTVLYYSDGLTVEFLEPDSTGLNIKIVNNYDEKTSPFFESLYINGDESVNYNGYTCSVPPHSTYIFHINTLDKNNDYFPSDVEYISGVVKFNTNGEGYMDEFDFDSRSSLTVKEESEKIVEENTKDVEGSVEMEPAGEDEAQEPIESEVETYYNFAMDLTKEDCTKNSLGLYECNGITFLEEDCNWIESPLNTEGTVNAGSFYRALQSCLQYFSMGNSWQSYAEHIIGYTPESRDEFEPYVEEYLTYMTDSWFGNSMMEKFQTMDSVSVTQDGEYYTCIINDVNECAEELNISAEMMGYILGGLHDSGATITFSGNSCVIEYHDYSSRVDTT